MVTENRGHIDRWFPTQAQLSDPSTLERTLRQVLTQHYDLVEQVRAMKAPKPAEAEKAGPPPGSGPTDSMLLGLRVAPVNAKTLADGAKLTYVKASGNLQFK
jgi:hypothetical protein